MISAPARMKDLCPSARIDEGGKEEVRGPGWSAGGGEVNVLLVFEYNAQAAVEEEEEEEWFRD